MYTNDKKPARGFDVEDGEGQWRPAEATLIGNKIEVWNERVIAPKRVRYAWSDAPDCNVMLFDWLPLRPFML
jgi:sialate O-acetylesterase